MSQNLVRFIEFEEFKKILSAEKDKNFKLAYVLAFGSGLRISEILGYEGISSKNKPIKIPPLTKEMIDLDKHQIILQGKGGKQRISVTSKWLTKSNLDLLPLKINRRTLQRRFTLLSKKVLGRSLNFHTLRHGFGNFMANDKGVPLPMVQQMLGHSRLDTTGIYTKSNPIKTIETAWEKF